MARTLGVNLLSREGNSLAGHKMALEERLEERFMPLRIALPTRNEQQLIYYSFFIFTSA